MWDKRYDTDDFVYGTEPNDFLAQHYQEIPAGRVLCLAEGEGRNAVFLARQGYQVTAVDASATGLAKAAKLAEQQSVELEIIHADLAGLDLGTDKWEGIVSIFCHLPPSVRQTVHARLAAALKPGGVLLLEAYTPAQLQFNTGGPPDAAMMMNRERLCNEIQGLTFRYLQETERDIIEGKGHTGHGAVVQAIAIKDNRRP